MPLSPNSLMVSAFSRLHPYLLPAAVVLASAGQIVLLRARPDSPSLGSTLGLGGMLLLLAAVAFGFATAVRSRPDAWPGDRDRASDDASIGAYPQWPPALMVSIAAAIAAIAIFGVWGESPIVVALWLAGILLLVVAQISGLRPRRLTLQGVQWGYVVGISLLVIIAVLTRAWHLTTLPFNVDGDFADVGLQARALASGEQTRIFTFGWAMVPILGYLPPWLTMLAFGTGLAGLNASGVVEGALIVLGVFLIGRELFNARVGLLAAALLVVSYTHMAASRQSSYIDPVFFITWALYFILIGLRKSSGWAMAAGGILTGLCLEMYYSGRIIIPVIGLALLYALIFQRSWLFVRWKGIVIFSLATLMTLGPMLVVFANHPGDLASHTQTVLITNPEIVSHMKSVYRVETLGEVIGQQAARAALMFHYFVDKGTQFALLHPYLDPVSGILFALGLGYVLFGWRRAGSWLVLGWILLGVILGCFLTVNPPFWARLIILLPPVALAAALGLNAIYEAAAALLARNGRAPVTLPILVIVLLAFVGVANWNTYVEVKGSFATSRVRIAHYLAEQPPTARAYLVSEGFTYADREFRFLVPGQIIANITPEEAEQPLAPAGSPTLLIITSEQQELAQRLAGKYAGGPIVGNTPSEVAFYVYQLP